MVIKDKIYNFSGFDLTNSLLTYIYIEHSGVMLILLIVEA